MVKKYSGTVGIESSPGLVRDMASMAVINTDTNGLARAKAVKKMFADKDAKLEELHAEVKEMRDSMAQIKDMLASLTNKDKK